MMLCVVYIKQTQQPAKSSEPLCKKEKKKKKKIYASNNCLEC